MSVGGVIISLQQKQERKTKMAKTKSLLEEIKNCDTCYGQGWLYYGNEDTYDLEPCFCNPESIEVEF
jgi:hypothetical protein